MAIIARDSFNRANSNTLGYTETGQKWQAYYSDSGSILNNRAMISSSDEMVFVSIGNIQNYSYSLEYFKYTTDERFIWNMKDESNYYVIMWGYVVRLGGDVGYEFIGSIEDIPDGQVVEHLTIKVVVSQNTHSIYYDNRLVFTFSNSALSQGVNHVGFSAYSSQASMDNFLVETVDENPTPSAPIPTIVSISKSKISPKPLMNQSVVKVKFDQDVTEYVAKLGGVSYDTGTTVHVGGAVSADVEADVIIDWNEMTTEGINTIYVYGRSINSGWTKSST